jgi:hypothetical protein
MPRTVAQSLAPTAAPAPALAPAPPSSTAAIPSSPVTIGIGVVIWKGIAVIRRDKIRIGVDIKIFVVVRVVIIRVVAIRVTALIGIVVTAGLTRNTHGKDKKQKEKGENKSPEKLHLTALPNWC